MFRCESCGKPSEPGERPKRLVVETRERTYRQCDDCGKTYAADPDDEAAARTDRKIHAGCDQSVTVTVGSEIVREINVHERCAQ